MPAAARCPLRWAAIRSVQWRRAAPVIRSVAVIGRRRIRSGDRGAEHDKGSDAGDGPLPPERGASAERRK